MVVVRVPKGQDITGVPMNRAQNVLDAVNQYMDLIPRNARVAFVAVGLSVLPMKIFYGVRDRGDIVTSFSTRSVDLRNPRQLQNVRVIQKQLGQKARIDVMARTSLSLIERGQWVRDKTTIVLFPAGMEGFLCFLKGCAVPVYTDDEMENDLVSIYAGNHHERERMQVTEIGGLIHTAQRVVAPFHIDADTHNRELARMYQIFSDHLCGILPSQEWTAFKRELRGERFTAERLALDCMEQTRLLPGKIAYCDFTGLGDQRVHIPTWRGEVVARYGPVLSCFKRQGADGGELIQIQLLRSWSASIDLREYFPNAVPSVHRNHPDSYRVAIPADWWDEFQARWIERWGEAGPQI